MSDEARPAETENNVQQDDLLEQIAQRRHAEVTGEPGEENNPTATPETAPEPAKQLVDDLTHTYVKAKVYGEEREVPVIDLLKNYQIEQAAEVKLQQAKDLERQLQQRLAELDTPQPPAPQPQTAVSADKKAAFESLLEAWSNGEELPDDQLTAFLGNTSPTQQPQIDPAEIAHQVRAQFEVDDGLSTYRTDYADIASDPYLDAKAAEYLEVAMQSGKPFKQALIEGAEKTRQWLRDKVGTTTHDASSNANSNAEKRAKAQASLRNAPVSTVNARQPIGQPKPPSLDEMRRSAIEEMMNSS